MSVVLIKRGSIERLTHLAEWLRAGRVFTAREVAGIFSVSRKTITRDLVFMRERLGWEFNFDFSTGSYRLRNAPAPRL